MRHSPNDTTLGSGVRTVFGFRVDSPSTHFPPDVHPTLALRARSGRLAAGASNLEVPSIKPVQIRAWSSPTAHAVRLG